jgi:hypothetical protein
MAMSTKYPNSPGQLVSPGVSITGGQHGSLSIGIAGAGGGGSSANYTVNTSAMDRGSMSLTGTIEMTGESSDIKINTKSMKKWMESVEKRLLILEPKPELLAKHEALRNAYEHYKTLEAILYDEKE